MQDFLFSLLSLPPSSRLIHDSIISALKPSHSRFILHATCITHTAHDSLYLTLHGVYPLGARPIHISPDKVSCAPVQLFDPRQLTSKPCRGPHRPSNEAIAVPIDQAAGSCGLNRPSEQVDADPISR